MKKNVLLILLILISDVFANGAPIIGNDTVIVKSGNFKFSHLADVSLIKENLFVERAGDYCKVNVEYYLKNNAKDSSIDFSFPIDFCIYEYSASDGVSLNPIIKDYKISLNDVSLKFDSTYLDSLKFDNYYKFPPSPSTFSRRFYTSKLPLKGNKINVLSISYFIETFYDLCDNYGDPCFCEVTPRIFVYDLSPAGYWANGIVNEFNLTIKKNEGMTNDEMEIYGFDSLEYSSDFIKKSLFNFDISKAYLTIIYDLTDELMKPQLKGFLPKEIIKKISTSSTLKGNYKKENLIDENPNTAWVEGAKGSGKNEWIEFEFCDSVNICGISILNGYTKNLETFQNNNKVKKLTVEVHYGRDDSLFVRNYEMSFKDRVLKPVIKGDYFTMLDFYEMSYWDGPQVKKIRFIVSDMYKGKKFDDTCISEIHFYGTFRKEL